jgi:hypothetical protein
MIRPADGSVSASLEIAKAYTVVECCETLAENVVVFHSLCKNLRGTDATATRAGFGMRNNSRPSPW